MKIYRTIYAKSFEEIDLNSIGNHWSTSDNIYTSFNPFTESNELRGKDESDYIQFFIEAEINEGQINEKNEELRDNSSNENEIITKFNCDIEILICDDNDILFEGLANTGERYQEIMY